MDAELIAKEHEAGKKSVLEILKFAKRERDELCAKIGENTSNCGSYRREDSQCHITHLSLSFTASRYTRGHSGFATRAAKTNEAKWRPLGKFNPGGLYQMLSPFLKALSKGF